MREVLAKIGPLLRSWGFRGSGQTFRKTEGDLVFVLNFQGSLSGDSFYVNLGAQPTFIPAEGDADLKTIKAYECLLQDRVGEKWSWQLSGADFEKFVEVLQATQESFFGNAKTLKVAIAGARPEFLLESFSYGHTSAGAVLHLARAAVALGYGAKAGELAQYGLELIGDRAIGLRYELEEILAESAKQTTENGP